MPQAFDENLLHNGLERLAGSSNYIDLIADLCRPHLGDRCLEIGAGHGLLTERLAAGHQVVATDVSPRCLAELHQRFDSVEGVEVRELDAAALDLSDETFDSVVMINVLEHIEDDATALRTLSRAITTRGSLVVYVPAFNMLYSRWDRLIRASP